MGFNFKINKVFQDGNTSVQRFCVDGHYFNLFYENEIYPISMSQYQCQLKNIKDQKLNATIFSNGFSNKRSGLKVSLNKNVITSLRFFNQNIKDINHFFSLKN